MLRGDIERKKTKNGNHPLPIIMNRILSLTWEPVCYFIQADLLYDISSGKYPLTGLFIFFAPTHLWGHFIRKVPLKPSPHLCQES